MGFYAGVSKYFGESLNVTKKSLGKVGLGGVTDLNKTRVIGPRASNSTTANLVTGRGAGRRYVSKDAYEGLHTMRGKKIVGGTIAGGGMAVAGRRDKASYYNPPRIQTPQGSGRFA